jgi:hypothetical protein
MDFGVHLGDQPEGMGQFGGAVTVTFSTPSETPRKKSRTALLPLLIALFVISYSILTMLVIEQGRTIEAQRTLLREMLKDSSQLAELKDKMAREEAAKQVQPSTQAEQAQPEQKEPAANKGPAASGSDKVAKHAGKSARSLKSVPEKPAADLEDVRRTTRVL